MREECGHSHEEHSVQPPTDFDDGGSRSGLRRRGVLKTLGVAGTAALGSWSAVGNVAASEDDEDEDDDDTDNSESSFPPGAAVRGATIESLRGRGWDVVDVVEAGIDNTGETAVQDGIADLMTEETVLVFPDGEYLFQGSVVDQKIDHIAVIGAPDTTPTFVVGAEFDATERDFPNYSLFTLGFSGGGSGIVFRNLEFDMEGDGIGAGGIQPSIKGDGGYFKDIEFVGENDSNRDNISTEIPDKDAVLSIHDVRMPDGASRTSDRPSTDDSVGIIATAASEGDLHLGNCVVGGFPNNGVYASKVGIDDQPGKVIVRGGRFFNSDRDQLRVGSQSEIHDVYCYSDRIKPGFDNLRGIWVRHADGVLIENTTIEQKTSDSGAGIRVDFTSGKTTVRDTDIRLESPGHAIWGTAPALPTGGDFARPPGSSPEVVCEDVTITGTASGRAAVRIEKRDGSGLEDLCVHLTGADRDGVRFIDTETAAVTDSRINVTGRAIIAENSDVTTDDIEKDGSCEDDEEDGDDDEDGDNDEDGDEEGREEQEGRGEDTEENDEDENEEDGD